ncbi:MAG: hypothetical protein L0H55_16095 [Candidatus Nitrosocosmicus sp.]|nr:hypothetical protein [Candidatus Nitrosocosmicus sp.]
MASEELSKVNRLIDLVNESVHTQDDVDIGDMEAVNNNFVVVKRGFVNVHYYYIPINQVEGWDSNVLWLKVSESDVIKKYERALEPDPFKYYVKNYPYYAPGYYSTLTYNPIMPIIPSRYVIPSRYTPTVREEISNIIQCDLCQEHLSTEEELNKHISKQHM